MDFRQNRIKAVVDTLKQYCWKKPYSAVSMQIAEADYNFSGTFEKNGHQWNAYKRDETWGGTDRHKWFCGTVTEKDGRLGENLYIMVGTGADDIWNTDNPQILAYLNGKLCATMDMNHQIMKLTDCLKPGDSFEIAFYAYSNSAAESNFFHVDAVVLDEMVKDLYFDMKVIYETAELLETEDLAYETNIDMLNHCVNLLDLRKIGSDAFYASLVQAEEYLHNEYYGKQKDTGITVHSIGHTHIDVAWKWPLRQTRQKAVRSFQTVLNLMERYPEYRFMSSQPQLYEFVKEEAPWLIERIKDMIKAGRWEAEGAMWLEPDCNLSSGESLVRHMLYGTRFFEQEMGAEKNEVLWLPDVFGYCAALPQIMKQFQIPYFMTTKLGWNDHNEFPYDTFYWKGIDGSQVLTHLITTKDYDKGRVKRGRAAFNTTYNGMQNPSQIMGTWQRYQNKAVSQDLLTCYGYGDGGGGPTAEMLEQDLRLEQGVAGCPKTRQTFVKEFFHILEQNVAGKRMPIWSGELYLEYHRGTYTSMAENKKNNRQCEFLNQDSEFYSVLAAGEMTYPRAALEHNWKLLLLNQFHDILPGSSIAEVYEDSERQYQEIRQSAGNIIAEAQEKTVEQMGADRSGAEKNAIAVWNTLGFVRRDLVELNEQISGMEAQKGHNGNYLYLLEQVPSKGMAVICHSSVMDGKVISDFRTDDSGRIIYLKTDFYEAVLNENAEIVSLVDLEEDREIIGENGTGNRLRVFEDRPMEYDAWNIDPYYEEKSWDFDAAEKCELIENGPYRACIRTVRKFMDSELEQYIYFYRHSRRIDFRTKLDWHQHQLLLKAEFPVSVKAEYADYEVQFGTVKRPTHYNTSWDQAKFEVCAHKWGDLSDTGYGVALLNDCRYGYDIHDSVMRLTLLKSGIFPNPNADIGLHEFTYAIYPHKGDFRSGGVTQEAFSLNRPLQAMAVCAEHEKQYFIAEAEEDNVVIDSIKCAENSDAVLIRLYEAYGMQKKIHLHFGRTADIFETDLAEREEKLLAEQSDEVSFTIKPYEIKTIVLHSQKQ